MTEKQMKSLSKELASKFSLKELNAQIRMGHEMQDYNWDDHDVAPKEDEVSLTESIHECLQMINDNEGTSVIWTMPITESRMDLVLTRERIYDPAKKPIYQYTVYLTFNKCIVELPKK